MPTKFKLKTLQREVLSFFGSHQLGQSFYWTGGTLLAYQYLQHRLSTDIDLFSENLLADDEYLMLANDLKKQLKLSTIQYTLQMNRHLFTAERQSDILKLELVYFPFAQLEPGDKLPEFNIHIDSLTDIMANKILSTYQRQEPKDAFDLYFYLSGEPHNQLLNLLKLAGDKFGVSIEPALLLSKLNELAGQLDTLQPLLLKKQPQLAQKVKTFFQQTFNQYAQTKLR